MFPMLEVLTGEKPKLCSRIPKEEYSALIDNMQKMCSFDISRILTDITPAEFTLLYQVAVHCKQKDAVFTVAQAATTLQVTVPAVSRTLKNLEKKELIARTENTKDRRSVIIDLTEKGNTILIENLRRYENTMEHIVSHFSKEEIHTMIRLQTKFVQAACDLLSKA